MKYQIKKLEANNFDVFELGKVSPRSYFIPYIERALLNKQSALTERYNSDMVTVLSGDWNFKYYEKISRLPTNIDTDKLNFDVVKVPSTWQRTGYESPVYLNTRYEFPMTLPNVPSEMSAGIYTKKFSIKEETKHTVITFLGVCSCLTLYVNGKFVGYSEGSHNMAEFNLDSFVVPGENELLAIVTKWSNGTYLECQDMFRENGIFRDVYITELPDTYIFDYQAKAEKSDEGWELTVEGSLCGKNFSNKSICVELVKDEKILRAQTGNAGETFSFLFSTPDVKQWTAETPELYDLFITLKGSDKDIEVIRSKIGFKKVQINGELFLFNGEPIKFKGVNHHDTNEKTGYVMTADDILKDIKLMKEFNVNAVRTSHYPPDPMLIALCDEYGLYVIDEADIETHGTQFSLEGKFTMKPNIISNGKEWLSRYLDRVNRMYERDKNHPSITMWSLGNESGGWKNHDECYKLLKSKTDIPVHYEGAIRTPRGSYDVISEMYQHPFVISKIAKHSLGSRYKNKPYFLCEYCHAMGLGPGALEDYWKLIYENDNLTGGCIWEWADHSVYDKNAKHKYTYGGDHGEKFHDGNFCVDGLFFPNRKPHTGAYAMKATYRPVRAQLVSDNLYLFTNTNRFLNANIYTVDFELLCDGEVVDSGKVALDIEPRQSQSVVIAHKMTDREHDYFINFIYKDASGNLVAKEQLTINENIRKPELKKDTGVAFLKKNDSIIVAFENGRAVFDNTTGILVSYIVNSKEMLADEFGLVPNIYRAPLDNDRNKVGGWEKQGLDKLRTASRKITECSNDKDGYVKIKTSGILEYTGKKVFSFELDYKIYPDGTMKVKTKLSRPRFSRGKVELSRFGIILNLDRSLKNVRYYGLGELENLPDFASQSVMGIYESNVFEMCEDYIKPQENGMHTRTRFVSLCDDEGSGVEIVCKDAPFTFSARPYANKTLNKAKHIEDVGDDKLVSLNVDGFVRGTGTNSCGPDVLSDYNLHIKDELKFSFYIRPKK